MFDFIKSVFEEEFACILEKIALIPLGINEAYTSKNEHVYKPGTYVFWKEEEIIKVGRSLTNSRKRALQHIRDNTRNESIEMKGLKEENNCGLILINCKKQEDAHWVAAIEIYLEKKLKPMIRSKRQG